MEKQCVFPEGSLDPQGEGKEVELMEKIILVTSPLSDSPHSPGSHNSESECSAVCPSKGTARAGATQRQSL